MKRILLFLVFFFILSRTIIAQPFPTPDQNPIWTFYVLKETESATAKYIYGRDTLIWGETWNSVSFEGQTHGFSQAWIRTEGAKVYARFSKKITIFSEREYLIYDFALKEGDTISCPIFTFTFFDLPQPQLALFKVTKVDTLEYEGVSRKTLFLNFSAPSAIDPFEIVWIEGLGATIHPLYPLADWDPYVEFEVDYILCNINLNGKNQFKTRSHFCSNVSNNIIYVDQQATDGNNDGTSWLNAYQNLQTALLNAAYGSQVWVADGTYYPTNDPSDREASFNIPTGVKIYGGFGGTEGALSQRKLGEYPTILSGNIGMKEDSTDNAYHVVIMSDPDSNTVMDGFTVQDGHAVRSTINREPFSGGGGLYIRITSENHLANPIIEHCTFNNNVAQNGGAINITSKENYLNAPQMKNCTFFKNRATTHGGAIFKGWGGAKNDTFLLAGNLFFENYALVGGGAVYLNNLIHGLKIIDCKFNNNGTRSGGGGITFLNHKTNASFYITNTEFRSNHIRGDGGAIAFYNTSRNVQYDYKFVIKNVRFSDNRTNNNIGGALFFGLLNSANLRLDIDGSTFENNFGVFGGGGIAFDVDPFSNTVVSIKNSKFIRNQSSANVLAGIYYSGSGTSTSSFKITNTLFAQNEGAFVLVSGNEGFNESNFVNCTFYQNGQQPIGKSWNPDNTNPNIQNKINLVNTIIWEPQISEIGEVLYNGDYNNLSLFDYSLNNCLISASTCDIPGSEICSKDNLFGKEPLFQNEINGNFSLKPCSPAINAGIRDSLFNAFNLKFDLGGNPRILEDHPDIGAYEVKAIEPFKIEMVRLPNCFDSQDGEILFKTPADIPFQINWEDTVSSANRIDHLGEGNYTFFLTTEDHCTDSITYSMKAPDPIQFDYSIIPASGSDVPDGEVQINSVNGGSPPYHYVLIQGDSVLPINQLQPGTYRLQVVDTRGCLASEEVVISFVSDLDGLDNPTAITLFPNPIQGGELNIQLTHSKISKSRFSIKNIYGQDIGINGHLDRGNNVLNMDQLASGIYLLQVEIGQTKYIKRFIKN